MKKQAVVVGLVAALGAAVPAWGFFGIVPAPDLSLDFVANYSPQGTISSLITTTRNSIGTASDVAGNWYRFANNIPRITNQGLLVEEARTNSIRNNSMVGAVVGTPGTPPTNWTIIQPSTLAAQIVAIGTVQGINYIDVRWSGTPNATNQQSLIVFENGSSIAASNGQVWSNSAFIGLTAGSTANVTNFKLDLEELPSGNQHVTNFTPTATFTRIIAFALTLNQANTTNITSRLLVNLTSGQPVDITLRFGWPQVELGASATSPIPTTNAAVTRAADNIKATNPPTLGTNGTLYSAFTPQAPLSYGANQIVIEADDGSNNNRNLIQRNVSGSVAPNIVVGGAGQSVSSGAAVNTGVFTKAAFAYQVGNSIFGLNGTSQTMAPAALPVVSSIRIGSNGALAAQANAYIRSSQVWANQALTSAQLQNLTQ